MNPEESLHDVPVAYPVMRNELLMTLRALADPTYQQNIWVERNFPNETFYDDYDMAIHTLYDDLGLDDEGCMQVGFVLCNQTVADLVHEVIVALEHIFDTLGVDSDFEVIRRSNGWPEVIRSARVAYTELQKSRC